MKASLGFYIGGMGAKGQNYHTKLMARMGYEEEAYRIQDLFFEGKRDEAIAAVPDDFADEISLVGPGRAHQGAARGVAQEPGHHHVDLGPHARGAQAGRRPRPRLTAAGPQP